MVSAPAGGSSAATAAELALQVLDEQRARHEVAIVELEALATLRGAPALLAGRREVAA